MGMVKSRDARKRKRTGKNGSGEGGPPGGGLGTARDPGERPWGETLGHHVELGS